MINNDRPRDRYARWSDQERVGDTRVAVRFSTAAPTCNSRATLPRVRRIVSTYDDETVSALLVEVCFVRVEQHSNARKTVCREQQRDNNRAGGDDV